MNRKRRVKKLKHPDSFHLQAAEGWFELGDLVAANNELDEISPLERAHPAVLIMRYEIYAKAGYCAQLGELEESKSWFTKAMEIEEKVVKRMAISDADLKPLWDSMKGTIWKRE